MYFKINVLMPDVRIGVIILVKLKIGCTRCIIKDV